MISAVDEIPTSEYYSTSSSFNDSMNNNILLTTITKNYLENNSNDFITDSSGHSSSILDKSFNIHNWLRRSTLECSQLQKQGVLYKQCPSLKLLWQSRYFVLNTDGSIYYYKNESHYKTGRAPRGVILLSDLQCSQDSPHSEFDAVCVFHDRINIAVKSKKNRIYRLKSRNPEEADEWLKAIHSHLPL